MPNVVIDELRIKRTTASTWVALNPVLLAGEPGLESDTRLVKFGDGVTAWNSLSYGGVATHNHDVTYSPVAHNHDGTYSPVAHDHSGVYSPVAHNHDVTYSPVAHNHDGTYSPVAHNHDGTYSPVAHNHVDQLPIPTSIIPTYNVGGTTQIVLYRHIKFASFTATGNTTITFDVISGGGWLNITNTDYFDFTTEVTDGGSHTITWPVNISWDGGIAPTLTAVGTDILAFYTIDGGASWRGFVAALDIGVA